MNSEEVDIHTSVLVVGGGGAGLTASMLLSRLGVDSYLVNSLPTTSQLPKAHILNQRAMEIMRDCGVSDAIYDIGTPPEAFSYTAAYVGFAGHPDAGQRIAKLECWGTGGRNETWTAASPLLSTNLPQIRLEPILRQQAESLAPGKIHFHHELTHLEQVADGVTATILNKDTNETYRVFSTYVLACDGGRTVGKLLDIEMRGLRKAASQVSFHISTDFSQWNSDDDVLIRWVGMPQLGVQVVMVPMGPTTWGSRSEEWVVHLNYPYDDPRSLDDATVEQDMRDALGIADHPMTIHKISRWASEGIVAERFSDGRIFLCGDAAHRHPPTGGLGLTSGMHDVQNICWKLALVVQGKASEALLQTYETERRPVVERNVQRSLENAKQWTITWKKLGLSDPSLSTDEKWVHLSRLWSTDPADDDFKKFARDLFAHHSMEFQEQNVEYGYTYNSTAVVADGSSAQPNPDDIRLYISDTRPGHPLPHAWVEKSSGTKVSTVDLVASHEFLLIAGEEGEPWCESARDVAQSYGIALRTIRIGHTSGDYLDTNLSWLKQRQFSSTGAILVRPDRFIAWRSFDASASPLDTMKAVFKTILHVGGDKHEG